MKRILLLSLVLMLGGVSFAWAGQEAYRLALSKREALCAAMLALINTDVKQYREIRYETHQYFNDITWSPADTVLGDKFSSDFCMKYSVAKFDIDNDGHRDFVFKQRGCLRMKLTDNLYVYGDGDAVPNLKEYTDIEDLSRVKIPMKDFNSYQLDEVSEPGSQYPKVITGHLVIQPFAYSRTNYLLITNEHRYWIAISRLLTRPQLDNVCILQMTDEEGSK
jgi:hypothetical protein